MWPRTVHGGARHRLEALVAHAQLGGVEGEHRRIAADRTRQQELERRRRDVLAAHVHRLADDELEAAALAFDPLIELPDRRHLDLDVGLRPFRRLRLRTRAVALLARRGDFLERRKAVADFLHS
jgi:hypothetical protein